MVIDLLLENSASRADLSWIGGMMGFGMLAGLGGSLVSFRSVHLVNGKVSLYSQLDSLLGALFQRTLYSTKDKRIITDHSPLYRMSRSRSVEGITQIGPGLDILSNTGVNFVCGSVMGLLGYWWGSK